MNNDRYSRNDQITLHVNPIELLKDAGQNLKMRAQTTDIETMKKCAEEPEPARLKLARDSLVLNNKISPNATPTETNGEIQVGGKGE